MKVKTTKHFLTFLALGLFASTTASAQSDTLKNRDYESLSLKDLLNVKIVSASKKSELLFEAPLSASVVTAEEIRRSGASSLMEALRLVPGMIVREQSNGNYDIHLRGMDNVPPNAAFDVTSNTTTLVMIDSRPIYSYLKGGTFWETLPIDINDVERIEVVRGPAAALYGPNAVNGVINFITRQPKEKGLFAIANTRVGNYRTLLNNASVGYKGRKFSAIVSGNYAHRNRSQSSYFEFNRNAWVNQPAYFLDFTNDTANNVNTRYPNADKAMDKYAGNAFLNYDPLEKVSIRLTTGIQHSIVQKVSTENEITPLSTAKSDVKYADLRAGVKDLTAQVSFTTGTQITDLDPGNKYDFHTFDANVEYNYVIGKLSLKPGIAHRNAVYDDTKYSDTIKKAGIFNARGKIVSSAASLRAEYNLLASKLRLVAGVTANKFNYPDTTYLSYQVAATYRLRKDNLFRIVFSEAPRSSNVFDTYIDQTLAYFPSGNRRFTRMALQGNKDLQLLTSRMIEVGYRARINSRFNLDIEVFNIHGKNYSSLVQNRPYQELHGTDTLLIRPLIPTNLPLKLEQTGVTISLDYSTAKFHMKPFVTFQKTLMRNYSPSGNMPDAGMGPLNIYSKMGFVETLKSTPKVFGGGSLNYAPSSQLNFNVNCYYYSAQTYYHLSNTLFNDGIRGIDHIEGKMIVNASALYQVNKTLTLNLTGKNLFNKKMREFFRTDETPFMILGGITCEF